MQDYLETSNLNKSISTYLHFPGLGPHILRLSYSPHICRTATIHVVRRARMTGACVSDLANRLTISVH